MYFVECKKIGLIIWQWEYKSKTQVFVGKKTKLELLRVNTKRFNCRICMKKESPSKEHGKNHSLTNLSGQLLNGFRGENLFAHWFERRVLVAENPKKVHDLKLWAWLRYRSLIRRVECVIKIIEVTLWDYLKSDNCTIYIN